MKRYNCIIFILTGFVLNPILMNAQSKEYQSWVDSAEQAYLAKQYDKAIDYYARILDHGMESADFYYNMANAYYRNQQLVEAILFYEKALKLDPSHEDAKYNLQLANSFMTDRIVPLKGPFYKRWYKQLWQSFKAETWAYISLISFAAFLIMIFVFIFSKRVFIKKSSIPIGIATLFISVSAITLGNEAKNFHENPQTAIIFKTMINVKSSPDESGTNLFTIHEGIKVEVRDKVGDWAEIRIADGRVGWVPESSYKKI